MFDSLKWLLRGNSVLLSGDVVTTKNKLVVYISLALLIIVGFQNCSKEKFHLDLSSSSPLRTPDDALGPASFPHLTNWQTTTRNIAQGTEPPATQPFPLNQRPEAPRLLHDVHEVDITRTADGKIARTNPQFYRSIRPVIPPVRTTHDGRVGFNWADLKLYVLAPERITRPFPLSESGPQIVTNQDGLYSQIWDFLSIPEDQGQYGGYTGATICNSVDRQNQPRKCGNNDCYDLSYVGFRTYRSPNNQREEVDQAEFRSRKVVIEVSNPKTASASVVKVYVAPGSVVRRKERRIQIDLSVGHSNFGVPEPVVTGDGRLYVGRAMYNPILDVDRNGTSGNKNLDIFYMVAPKTSDPCDAQNFSYVKRIQYAPDDPEMKDSDTGKARYGIAEYPMKDSFGDLIAKDALFPIYPWIDREGNNLFFATVSSTLYKFNTKDMSYYQEVSPGTRQWLMVPGSERYPARCLREFGQDCQVSPYNPESNDNVRGFAVLGSWTHGKTVILDGLINNSDYGLKRGIKFQRELNLYQPSGAFDGWVRVGPGRDTGDSGNGLDSIVDDFNQNSEIKTIGKLTGVIDSTENLLNAYRFMRPTLPRDIVWQMNNSIGTDEVAFDDYMDTRALIVSTMIAGVEFVRNPNEYRDDGWSYRDGFGWAGHDVPDQNNRPVLIQNAATSPGLPIPKWGYLNKGRVEPVALGGIHGRGLWMDGSNSLSYQFPSSVEGTQLFLSIFFDSRSTDDSRRQLVAFPDGTKILVNSAGIRISKNSETYDLAITAGKNTWNHFAVGVSSDHKVLTVYHNGMKKQSYSLKTQFFRINGAKGSIELKVGANGGSGFRGWVDDLKLFTYIPTSEVICNHAYGSFHFLKANAHNYWQGVASSYDSSVHREIYSQLPASYTKEMGIGSDARFVCTTDYGDSMGIYRSRMREGEGLLSVRDALLFAVPVNNAYEDGRLHWNTNRVDFRGNAFCLSCHTSQERRGLTLAALEPGQVCTMYDRRRQPLEPPLYMSGQITSSQLGAIDSNYMSMANVTDSNSGNRLVDPLVLLTSASGATCGSASPPPASSPTPTPTRAPASSPTPTPTPVRSPSPTMTPQPSSTPSPVVTPAPTEPPVVGSGADHSNNGWIDSAQKQSDGSYIVYGWACAKNHPNSIQVDLYVGGAFGTGKSIGRFWANRGSEPEVAKLCQSTGSAYRFAIPISASAASVYAGLSIWIHGINPFDSSGAMNTVIPNSGKVVLPGSNVDHSNNGWIDSMQKQSDGSYMIYGWACAKNFSDSILVDVYFGGPYGKGTVIGRFRADRSSEPKVAELCKSTGANYRFAIPVPAATAQTFSKKKIYIHGINPFDPAGSMNTVIPNSGVVAAP